MASNDLTISFTVTQPPEAVFAAINDVRAWWSGAVEGSTNVLGATFTYRYQDLHSSRQTITELVPDRLVVWHVDNSQLNFISQPTEWDGTDVVFEIVPGDGATEVHFTHRGLTPDLECYEACAGAWNFYVVESLQRLIATGNGQPDCAE